MWVYWSHAYLLGSDGIIIASLRFVHACHRTSVEYNGNCVKRICVPWSRCNVTRFHTNLPMFVYCLSNFVDQCFVGKFPVY